MATFLPMRVKFWPAQIALENVNERAARAGRTRHTVSDRVASRLRATRRRPQLATGCPIHSKLRCHIMQRRVRLLIFNAFGRLSIEPGVTERNAVPHSARPVPSEQLDVSKKCR